MLHDFIAAQRDRIIARTREKLGRRATPLGSTGVLDDGIPEFLDEFSAHLEMTETEETNTIGRSATARGGALLAAGFTIAQVVYNYGDICQAITQIAVETQTPISTASFKTLNMCLDVAIAEAVTEFSRQQQAKIVGDGVEHLGFLVHELRNFLNTATLAFAAVSTGSVGVGGTTGQLVASSLASMADLVTRSLAEVRLEGTPPADESISIVRLLEEIGLAATMRANQYGVHLALDPGEDGLAALGDPLIVGSILQNLVQNACKCTPKHGHVAVSARTTEGHVLLDVADECGGLPPGAADDLFLPYSQRGADRSGLGLGLAISRKGARAIGGELSVRDRPGVGCTFTLAMRRAPDVA